MHPDLLTSLRSLSDADLLARVVDLAARERGATVLLVAHLAELDTRDVHLRAGHGSLFAYCRDGLGLAEQEAYNRIAVARAARRFPVILEMLDSGSLNLTAVRLLGPHLTPANHGDVLQRARGKTKVQLEEIAAALWPRPDAPSFVRKLPARPLAPVGGATADAPRGPSAPHAGVSPPDSSWPAAPAAGASTQAAGPSAVSCFTSDGPAVLPAGPAPDTSAPSALSSSAPSAPVPADFSPTTPVPPPPVSPSRRSAEVTPLAPDRYKVQVTIGSETLEKLQLAKDLLRHAVPSGDEAVILDRALTALLADLAQKRFGATEKPRPSNGTAPGSRRVPAEVRREVWLRDRGRCAFVGTGGRRCSEHAFLEFHHVEPYALGGEATLANIQLRCRSHNAYEARLYFGRENGVGAPPAAAPPTRSGTSRRSWERRGPAP